MAWTTQHQATAVQYPFLIIILKALRSGFPLGKHEAVGKGITQGLWKPDNWGRERRPGTRNQAVTLG